MAKKFEFTSEERQQFARDVLQQLGGRAKLTAFTGANTFLLCEEEDGCPALSFKFKGSRKANHCHIALDYRTDTYKLKLGKIWGHSYKVVYELEGVYADMLIPVFQDETGLALSLGTMRG